jgi:hypothetical protein
MKSLRIVCKDFPGPGDQCVFVEVENERGKSVNAGEWQKRDDGLVQLVINLCKPKQKRCAFNLFKNKTWRVVRETRLFDPDMGDIGMHWIEECVETGERRARKSLF